MSYMLSDRLISPRRERPQTGLLQSLFLLFLKNTFPWISPVKVVKVSFRNPSASSRLGQNPEIEVIQKVRLHASDPPRRVSGIPLLSPPVGRQPPFSKSLNAAFSTGAGFVVVRRLKRGGATQGCWRMTRTYPNWRNSPQESSSAAKKCRVTNKNHLVTNI